MTTRVPQEINNTNFYERDYYLWLNKMVQLLRDDQLSELDKLNLIEELKDMGRSEKRAIKSNLTVLLMHLLKTKYQPEKRSKSWSRTIVEHRRRLLILLEDSPSLKNYLQEVFSNSYQAARQDAATETQLPLTTFPVDCPFSSENILNPNYLPNEE